MSYTSYKFCKKKSCDICNCSLVLPSVPEPCVNYGVSYGSSIYSWSRKTLGAEVDLRHWRSDDSCSTAVRNPICIPHFGNRKKQPTHIIDLGFIHYIQITDELLHHYTMPLLSACVHNVLGFSVQRKEMQFILRVPLLL